MSDFVYDGSYERRAEALARKDAGDRLVCYRCGAPLAVNSLAIYCTRDENHVSVHTLRRAPGEVKQPKSANDLPAAA